MWAFIPGTSYQASDSGEIRNKRHKIMKQRPAFDGGMQVDLGGNTCKVHKLVIQAFTGYPPMAGYHPQHRNGDKTDNRLINLVWAGKPSCRNSSFKG